MLGRELKTTAQTVLIFTAEMTINEFPNPIT